MSEDSESEIVQILEGTRFSGENSPVSSDRLASQEANEFNL